MAPERISSQKLSNLLCASQCPLLIFQCVNCAEVKLHSVNRDKENLRVEIKLRCPVMQWWREVNLSGLKFSEVNSSFLSAG